MEKFLKLFTYVDGRNDTPFPNEQEQVVVSEFRGDYKRMGATPTISCTVMHHQCLDKLWTDNIYATFNGEKFFIKQTASSSYDNTDSRYKHEVELVSERIILDNVYFYDVVQNDVTNDKPVSNSSNVVFFGDIHEFANRLNHSLQYSKVGYSVVVDNGISSESKMMSFQNQFFSNVLQEIYNNYGIPYYFVGKVIHIGYTNNAITHTFKYGVDESLLSIQKQNANYKVVNRVTGIGSADNIPYYYPNDYESKEEVEANGGTWINPQPNLMPSIYRETLGEERFYKALNNTYVSPQTGKYYYFENPFVEGKPKEHIVDFENIKPSIKGMLNASNQRMDMFVDFAYDAEDNDETDEEGNYLHPYFFAKLRKFDGDYGFNLFDHAIDEQEMVISMTSGSCGACEWVIGVDETSQKNTVQVNSSGNLVRDDKGNIKFGTPQDRQNDTRNYEVWVALKKDINTFGVIMPNASSNYKPSVNDTFVILHIDLPKAYILAAENNLKEQLIKYMAMNNSEKFTFSISFSRIFFAENPQILAQLNENARIQIEYDNTYYELYVSSYSYNMSNGNPLPEIKVELSDTLSVQQNALQNAISEVKQDILSSVGSGDFLKQGLSYFLRKDTSDRTRGKLSSDVGFEVGKYVSGASGAIIYKDSATGQTIGELDKLYVRMKAYFETLVISEVDTISGKQIISPAGSIKCIGVDELETEYRCYFLGEQDGSETTNLFHVNDQAYSQTFNAKQGEDNKISNTYYWRLITGVSNDVVTYKNQKCHYIDLSKTDCDNGSDIPKEGDIINHRGSRTEIDRMNFIESSSVDAFSPNITLFHGVNSYSLDGKDYVSYGVDKTTNKAYMNVYGDMFVGDRNGSTYMRYTPEEGLIIKGKLDIETKLGDSTLKDLISASSPEGYQEFVEKVTQDIEGLQQQIDGAIESYFYQYEPTLNNYPASDWDTQELKYAHLNDTFTNLVDGRSWRWTIDNDIYKWTEITDTATTQALALAGQAKDTADGKRRVFVSQPYPPYDKGDLWVGGKDSVLMYCVKSKSTGVYDPNDWDYADSTAKLEETISTFDYLKSALKEDTSIEGGLIQSSLLKLGYTSNNTFTVMSGTNGIYNNVSHGGGIASWWGGDTYDLMDYYNWNGTQWVVKSGVSVPSNIPSGLIRFDGTGYFAKGKFWWDKNGEIHADPTALLLSFDVAAGDETLASTIINIRKDLASFMDMWEVKKLSDGTEYLYSKRHLATNGGLSMYSNIGDLDIPTIYDGLPIDGTTIYWSNGVLKAKGGEGGVTHITSKMVVEALGYTPYSSANPNGYITSSALSGYATQSWVSSQNFAVKSTTLSGYGITDAYTSTQVDNLLKKYLPLSGGTITGDLRLKGSGNYGNTLRFGDGDYVYLKEATDDVLTIYASSGINLNTSSSSVKIDGIPLKKSADDVLFIDANVVVRGGLSTYGTDGTTLGSIWDNAPLATTYSNNKGVASFDPAFFSVINGYVSFIGQTGVGGGIESITKQMVIDALGYTPYNSTNPNGYITSSGSITGNAATATKVKNALSWSGYSSGSFDGSATKSITIPSNTNQLTNGAGFITSSSSITGNAATATQVYVSKSESAARGPFPFVYVNSTTTGSGNTKLYFHSASIGVDPKTNSIVAPNFKGNATTATTASKLSTVSKTAWGQTYWTSGGVPTSISGDMSNVGNIQMSAHNTNNIGTNTVGVKWIYANWIGGVTGGKFNIGANDKTAISISVDNKVGIGNTAPTNMLDITQSGWNNGLVLNRSASGGGCGIAVKSAGTEIGVFGINGSKVFEFGVTVNGTRTTKFTVDASGNGLFYGGVTQYSDIRKKTKLQDVELTLKQIADAPLIEHYYNSDKNKTNHVSSVAQYWAGMNDWFCKFDSEGFYTMELQNAALASAISVARHLQRYENKTDKTIRQLKKRISQLEDEIELLKKGE